MEKTENNHFLDEKKFKYLVLAFIEFVRELKVEELSQGTLDKWVKRMGLTTLEGNVIVFMGLDSSMQIEDKQ